MINSGFTAYAAVRHAEQGGWGNVAIPGAARERRACGAGSRRAAGHGGRHTRAQAAAEPDGRGRARHRFLHAAHLRQPSRKRRHLQGGARPLRCAGAGGTGGDAGLFRDDRDAAQRVRDHEIHD